MNKKKKKHSEKESTRKGEERERGLWAASPACCLLFFVQEVAIIWSLCCWSRAAKGGSLGWGWSLSSLIRGCSRGGKSYRRSRRRKDALLIATVSLGQKRAGVGSIEDCRFGLGRFGYHSVAASVEGLSYGGGIRAVNGE